ncbi:hypothetical protein, partial [Chromohalobacter sp. HP20-39]
EAVTAIMDRGGLSATTMLAVTDAVSWHAQYGGGMPGDAANRFLDGLPNDRSFRLRAAMVDRARFAFRGQIPREAEEDDVEKWLPA